MMHGKRTVCKIVGKLPDENHEREKVFLLLRERKTENSAENHMKSRMDAKNVMKFFTSIEVLFFFTFFYACDV